MKRSGLVGMMVTDDIFWAYMAIAVAVVGVALVEGFNLVVADALVRSMGQFLEQVPGAAFGR